jgi:putative endonuclease
MVRTRLELLARHAAVLLVDFVDGEFERSDISYRYFDISRDYDFWVYIMTNRNDSVLYIGVTNSLSRRTWEHREEISTGFASDYRCKKLIYFEHYRDIRTRSRGKNNSRNGRARKKSR